MKYLKQRSGLVIAALAGVVILAGLAWYLGSPLIIDRRVEEMFPFEAPAPEAIAALSQADAAAAQADLKTALPDPTELADLPLDQQTVLAEKAMGEAEKLPGIDMEEPMPGDEPIALLVGGVQGTDQLHQGSGSAKIYRLPDGSHVLRFEDLNVTNGPDLRVLLSSHPAPTSRSEVMQSYVDLGPLKGNLGSQNYEIPDDIQLDQIASVVIYCQPFHVVFATASLVTP